MVDDGLSHGLLNVNTQLSYIRVSSHVVLGHMWQLLREHVEPGRLRQLRQGDG